MKLDIDKLKEISKLSKSFPDLCRNLNLDPNKGNIRSNIERYCKRHNIDCSHFPSVKRFKDSKDRYNYEKLKNLTEKCHTLKDILIELDLLPVSTNYIKLKSKLNEYNLEFVYKSNYNRTKNTKPKYDENELREIVKSSHTYKECFDKMDIIPNYGQIKRYIKKYEIDTSHFNHYYNNGNRNSKFKIDTIDLLKENSDYPRTHLKKRLYDENILERKCCLCGQDENWNGMKISLILDHINGVNNDNRIENLRIVCPNCNAGLDTFAGRNIPKKEKKEKSCLCGKIINKDSSMCASCMGKKNRKCERPPLEDLISEVNSFGYSATGRKYGVSDNCIRKWIKNY